MLKAVNLNVPPFAGMRIPLSAVTLISGEAGTGKSTILNALGLLAGLDVDLALEESSEIILETGSDLVRYTKGMDPAFKASRVEEPKDIFSVLQGTQQGDILLLSHPEGRLSAFQQVALGEAIAIVGSAGVQVVVEYTSEHLFSGVRLQIKRKVIDHSDVTLIHLEKNRVLHIPIGKDARLHYWPTGFHDAIERTSSQLM